MVRPPRTGAGAVSQFRIVGVACDAHTRWTDDGVRIDTFGPNAAGAACGEEFTLMGGATYADVERDAKRDGWNVKGAGRAKAYLCPEHRNASEVR